MADSNTPASPAPSAPAAAPAAPVTPAGQAPAAQKTHHAAAQPRTPEGKFNGPPDPAKVPTGGAPTPETATPPPAPKVWTVDGRKFTDPDELATYTAEKAAEARAVEAAAQQLREYKARIADYEGKLKDPTKALTEEHKKAILDAAVREWQERDALSRMTPEARADYLARKELQQKVEMYEAEKAERERQAAEAKQKAEAEAQEAADYEARKELAASIEFALASAGLSEEEKKDPWYAQQAAWIMHGAATRGVVYPPEVVARKLADKAKAYRTNTLRTADLPSMLKSDKALLERLNGIEDEELLNALAPLGEKLRARNLRALGARPAAAPSAVATGATGPSNPQRYPPGDPRWQEEKERRIRGG